MELTPETKRKLASLAKKAGATHAKVISAVGLQLHENVRRDCAVNSCGRYGKTWTCPPGIGELPELRERLAAAG